MTTKTTKATNRTESANGNNITELIFILDRSGSMAGLEADTIGGFNDMIKKQKKQDGSVFVTTVLFDHEIIRLHDRVPLREIEPLTDNDYFVRGSTALMDAIGNTIHHIGQIHKYARPEDVPEHTMVVITTDGMENASRYYNRAEIKAMIEKEKNKYGWEFVFIGANIDAEETAAGFGISRNRAVNYNADSVGTRIVYEAVEKAVGNVRNGASLEDTWCAPINKDYIRRNKKVKSNFFKR